MNAEKTVGIIWACLERAVAAFNSSQDHESLLGPRCANPTSRSESAAAGERAIVHRLAFYLECELRKVGLVGGSSQIAVDCEYNRHVSGKKSLAAEAEYRIWEIVKQARQNQLLPDDDGFYVFSVAPDLVVHQRRTDANNLLVVELKKRSNPETEEYDALKLELFTKPKKDERGYGYRLGAWLVAEDECAPLERVLRINSRYENGVVTV